MENKGGPEAFFESLRGDTLAGPDVYFAQLAQSQTLDGCCHHHAVAHEEETSSEESGSEDGDIAEYESQFANLAIDTSVPLEGGLWRKLKKGAAAAVKNYRKTGKEERAAKKKSSFTTMKEEEAAEKTALKSDTPLGAPAPAESTAPAATTASPLPIASRELVNVLGKLVHRDINTSLPELSSAVLSATDIPNAYYANLALASCIGQLRLAVEGQAINAMDMNKLVAGSRATSVQKSALDTKTFDHLRNIMAVFASEINTMCTRPGEDGKLKAINQGALIGREFVASLGRSYLLGQKTVLSEAHPVVRLGAMLTSLLGMTYACTTHQTEISAAVHAAIKPVWSMALTKDTLHAVIGTHFD